MAKADFNTPVSDAGGFVLDANLATGIAVMPWSEVYVLADSQVLRFDLTMNYLGNYTTIQYMSVSQMAGFVWPSGQQEIFLADSEAYGALRYTFGPSDTTRATPIADGIVAMPPNVIPTGMVLAP